MKKHILFLVCIFCIGNTVFAFSLSSLDSIGLTTKNESKFIIHEVEAGETLFSLSRRYGVDTEAIKSANSVSVSSLAIGQRILIPVKISESTTKEVYHIVKPSETLFSISRQYDVTVDDLVKWNNLSDNSISIGEKLKVGMANVGSVSPMETQTVKAPVNNTKTHTVQSSQTLYSISRMYDISTDQLRSWNNLKSDGLKVGQVLIVSTQTNTRSDSNSSMLPPTNVENKVEPKSESNPIHESVKAPVTIGSSTVVIDSKTNEIDTPAEKVTQKGFAEVIEKTTETKKYLALHRDAQVGTIMQVRNEMNNQSVFVRIVGTIPATGDNAKVILKISKKAYDRLGAVDSRFPVEISYIP